MSKFHEVSKENKGLFPKSRIQNEDDDEKILKCAEEWISYYRCNPHLYANDVLLLGLKPFQQAILCSMFYNDYNMYIACRGQGKTMLLGAFVIIYSILFPCVKIAVCSRTIDQARETFNKVREFYGDSKALQNEIAEFGTSKQNRTITFKNGSKITIYPVSDNARGG